MMSLEVMLLRLTAFLIFSDLCLVHSVILTQTYANDKHDVGKPQYQKLPKSSSSIWSSWSSWSDCSRSCGGGVKFQARHCISQSTKLRSNENERKRRQDYSPNGCVGLYKRIHLCNTQECTNSSDFRAEQCAAFNHRTFKGKRYKWEPFMQVKDECALNCRPVKMDFYATLNKTVIDGTACYRPFSSLGKPATKGSKGICVAGMCKSINSKGVIGGVDYSNEECAACSKGSSCRSLNGIYTRSDLPPGYTLVTQIPAGACRILIQQLKHTRNYLALRLSNSSFILNGDYQFGNSRTIEAAGTKFYYVKQEGSNLETITSPGSLTRPVDIYIVTYHANLGIKYGYLLPNAALSMQSQVVSSQLSRSSSNLDLVHLESGKIIQPLHPSQQDEGKPYLRPRRLKRKYGWKISGISACSKPCGGGIQTTVVSCVRELTQAPVPDKRCIHLEKPNTNPIRCNTQSCPPKWEGYWSVCSVTCGEGLRRFIFSCKQEISVGNSVVVNDVLCSARPKPLVKTQRCSETPCDISDNELPQTPELRSRKEEWAIGSWSECSVTCGSGYRSRSVTCPSGHCLLEPRPSHVESCENDPCHEKQNPSPWLTTEWSKCSEDCGTGKQIRYAVCSKDTCEISSRPETSRDCSSDKECGGQWVVGSWGECGDSCSSPAVQKRDVYCIIKLNGQPHVTNYQTCPVRSKPESEQPCNGQCKPFWFTGDWGPCENCPDGEETREIKCMDKNGLNSNECQVVDAPPSRRPCTCHKREERVDKYKPAQDEPSKSSCEDKIRNCYLAVQARLCQYTYYMKHCCVACKKAPQLIVD